MAYVEYRENVTNPDPLQAGDVVSIMDGAVVTITNGLWGAAAGWVLEVLEGELVLDGDFVLPFDTINVKGLGKLTARGTMRPVLVGDGETRQVANIMQSVWDRPPHRIPALWRSNENPNCGPLVNLNGTHEGWDRGNQADDGFSFDAVWNDDDGVYPLTLGAITVTPPVGESVLVPGLVLEGSLQSQWGKFDLESCLVTGQVAYHDLGFVYSLRMVKCGFSAGIKTSWVEHFEVTDFGASLDESPTNGFTLEGVRGTLDRFSIVSMQAATYGFAPLLKTTVNGKPAVLTVSRGVVASLPQTGEDWRPSVGFECHGDSIEIQGVRAEDGFSLTRGYKRLGSHTLAGNSMTAQTVRLGYGDLRIDGLTYVGEDVAALVSVDQADNVLVANVDASTHDFQFLVLQQGPAGKTSYVFAGIQFASIGTLVGSSSHGVIQNGLFLNLTGDDISGYVDSDLVTLAGVSLRRVPLKSEGLAVVSGTDCALVDSSADEGSFIGILATSSQALTFDAPEGTTGTVNMDDHSIHLRGEGVTAMWTFPFDIVGVGSLDGIDSSGSGQYIEVSVDGGPWNDLTVPLSTNDEGFSLRVRASNDGVYASVRDVKIHTTRSGSSEYPITFVPLILDNVSAGSRYWVEVDETQKVLMQGVASQDGTVTTLVPFVGEQSVTVRVRKVGCLPFETPGIVTASGMRTWVVQIIDTVFEEA